MAQDASTSERDTRGHFVTGNTHKGERAGVWDIQWKEELRANTVLAPTATPSCHLSSSRGAPPDEKEDRMAGLPPFENTGLPVSDDNRWVYSRWELFASHYLDNANSPAGGFFLFIFFLFFLLLFWPPHTS